MHKVFISGSMSIKNLDVQVTRRIDNIVDSGYSVIVGDADGVDRAVQDYLHCRTAQSVVVYCSGATPRNNVGQWPIQVVQTEAKPGTRAFFTAKDVRMADDCDYGLMVWDTKSTGTLSNTIELLKREKYSVVFVNKLKRFHNVKGVDDLDALIGHMSGAAREKAEKKLGLNRQLGELRHSQSMLF